MTWDPGRETGGSRKDRKAKLRELEVEKGWQAREGERKREGEAQRGQGGDRMGQGGRFKAREKRDFNETGDTGRKSQLGRVWGGGCL